MQLPSHLQSKSIRSGRIRLNRLIWWISVFSTNTYINYYELSIRVIYEIRTLSGKLRRFYSRASSNDQSNSFAIAIAAIVPSATAVVI